MTAIKVTIVEGATGKQSIVKLPNNEPVGKILPPLAKSLGVQVAGTELKLYHKSPNPPEPFQFQDNDTLKSRSVKDGSILLFTHSFVAG
jgi:hypothetical protein